MNRQAGRVFTVVAAVAAASSLFVACAADQGDALKASSQDTSGSGSSAGAASGSTSASGATSGDTSGSGSAGSTTGSSGSASSGSIGSSGSSSAGSGSTSSGSSTSGGFPGSGSSGAADAGAEAAVSSATCIMGKASSLVVQFCTQDSPTATVSTIQFNLTLNNAAFASGNINLSDVTVRYWFNADGNDPSMLTFISYFSQTGNTNITSDISGTFAAAPAANMTPTSDSYLQLSFSAAAGMLMPLGNSASIQVAIHGPGTMYSDQFTEGNDYSFTAADKCPTTATVSNITVYVKGQLVWGCEPSAASGGSSSGSSSGASSGGDGGGGVDATAMPVVDAATE